MFPCRSRISTLKLASIGAIAATALAGAPAALAAIVGRRSGAAARGARHQERAVHDRPQRERRYSRERS